MLLSASVTAVLSGTHLGVARWCRAQKKRGSCAPKAQRDELAQFADVLGHQAAYFFAVCFLGGLGGLLWFGGSMTEAHEVVRAGGDRFHTPVEFAKLIGKINLGLQAYDLAATLLVPELRSAVMVLHHVVAGVAAALASYPAWFGIQEESSFFDFDTVFFYGVTELSTIPLAFHDAIKVLPATSREFPVLKTLDGVAQPLFAALFLSIRCIQWPTVVCAFAAAASRQLADNTLSSPVVVLTILSIALALTVLQFFWGSKILLIIVAKVRGGKGRQSEEKDG